MLSLRIRAVDRYRASDSRMIRMEVKGANELMAKFEQIKADMYKGFAAALVAGAFPVSNEAKILANYLTGNLRRSIHIATKTADITKPERKSGGSESGIQSAREVQKIADKLKSKGKAEVLIGTNVDYAAPQEFLHKPYLRPALDNNKDEVEAEMQRAVQMVIAKAEAAK